LFSDRFKLPRAATTTRPPVASERPPVCNRDAYSRHSSALEQFFSHIHGESGLHLLDSSGVSQANVGFITNLGCKLYSEDLVQTRALAFGQEDYESQGEPDRIESFLEQSLGFPPDHLDGVLLWDVLELLAPPLLKAVVDRLYYAVRPGSYLLAIFHGEDRAGQIPLYSYRISDAKTLSLTPRGTRQPAQFFNNRAIENLFQNFDSVKFFLTRDSLREVIVKR
jgi:hypothetical protein